MALFEDLYGWRYRLRIGWFEVGEAAMIGPYSVHDAMQKVQLIRDRLRIAQSRQKFYADVRRRELEFEVDNWVFLKVYPMKGVMRSRKKGILSPRYVCPYRIVKWVSKVAYKLKLPLELSFVHPVFHLSLLKKCLGDPALVVPVESVGVKDNLSYEEVLVEILDLQVCKLRNKEVASVKVLWRNQHVEGTTWKAETDMMDSTHIYSLPTQFHLEALRSRFSPVTSQFLV